MIVSGGSGLVKGQRSQSMQAVWEGVLHLQKKGWSPDNWKHSILLYHNTSKHKTHRWSFSSTIVGTAERFSATAAQITSCLCPLHQNQLESATPATLSCCSGVPPIPLERYTRSSCFTIAEHEGMPPGLVCLLLNGINQPHVLDGCWTISNTDYQKNNNLHTLYLCHVYTTDLMKEVRVTLKYLKMC